MNKPIPICIGQAAVHMVAAQLILRGMAVYFPAVDRGVDLVADNLRIQIKSTRSVSKHWRHTVGSYLFQLSKAQVIKQQKFVSCMPRKFSAICDFVILVAIDDNRYWIVPAPLLDNRNTAMISPTCQWKEFNLARAKELRATGISYTQIAAIMGVSHHMAMRRLKFGDKPIRKQTMVQIKECENRWDLLLSYSNTISEANEAASAPQGETQCRQV